jgi:hypothetical protein
MVIALVAMQASTQDVRSSKRELVSVCQNLFGDYPPGALPDMETFHKTHKCAKPRGKTEHAWVVSVSLGPTCLMEVMS